MRTFGYVVLAIVLSLPVWVGVIASYMTVFEKLGIEGGYNVRHGNTGAVGIGIYFLIAIVCDSILNGILGYHIAKAEEDTSRKRYIALTAAFIIIVPAGIAFGGYVMDRA